jgi:hypothetical protein
MIHGRFTLLAACAFVLTAACSPFEPTAPQCGEIPPNGCPDDDGLACTDSTCAAGYACQGDGTWSLVRTCPGYRDAGTVDATSAVPLLEAGALRDVTGFDVPPGANGGPGCVDLQGSDCALATALYCPQSSSDPCCGCEGLFLCGSDGWIFWGECTVEAGLTPAK